MLNNEAHFDLVEAITVSLPRATGIITISTVGQFWIWQRFRPGIYWTWIAVLSETGWHVLRNTHIHSVVIELIGQQCWLSVSLIHYIDVLSLYDGIRCE